MASINAGRVVAGGVVGGVVANACDIVWNMTVLKDDAAALMQKFGTDPATMNSAAAVMPWIAMDFVLAFLVVFTYAGIRPRFGPGPKTALIAGIIIYLAIEAIIFGFTTTGMMPMSAYVRGLLTALGTTIVGSLAGCAVYKEA